MKDWRKFILNSHPTNETWLLFLLLISNLPKILLIVFDIFYVKWNVNMHIGFQGSAMDANGRAYSAPTINLYTNSTYFCHFENNFSLNQARHGHAFSICPMLLDLIKMFTSPPYFKVWPLYFECSSAGTDNCAVRCSCQTETAYSIFETKKQHFLIQSCTLQPAPPQKNSHWKIKLFDVFVFSK